MWALVEHLPRDAALWQAEGGDWLLEHELAAGMVEAVDRLDRHQLLIGGVKQRDLGPPLRVQHPDRPGNVPEPQRATAAEIARFFSTHLKGG